MMELLAKLASYYPTILDLGATIISIIVIISGLNWSLIEGSVKGYKAFNVDFTCRDYQYRVGQTYQLPLGQLPKLCKVGYHFCQYPYDCDYFYPRGTAGIRYAEVRAWGVYSDGYKSVASKIEIVREIPSSEWETLSGQFKTNSKTVYLQDGQLHREKGPAIEHVDGTKEWYQNGQRYRVNGPAIEKANGDKIWYQQDLIHRNDGPAIERANGSREWYQANERHRDDGPAIETANGDEEWFQNDCRHRVNGPAVTHIDGHEEWWMNGMVHRDNGPAITDAKGTKMWYQKGLRHRVDGPAIEYADGGKTWYRKGALHRDDGPAIECHDGDKIWYRNGIRSYTMLP